MGQRLMDRVLPWFEEAFKDEPELVWEVTPMVHSQKGLVLYVGIVAPGAIMGTVISNGFAIPAPTTITERSAKEIALGLLEGIAESRTAQLQQNLTDKEDAVLHMTPLMDQVSLHGGLADGAPPR